MFYSVYDVTWQSTQTLHFHYKIRMTLVSAFMYYENDATMHNPINYHIQSSDSISSCSCKIIFNVNKAASVQWNLHRICTKIWDEQI